MWSPEYCLPVLLLILTAPPYQKPASAHCGPAGLERHYVVRPVPTALLAVRSVMQVSHLEHQRGRCAYPSTCPRKGVSLPGGSLTDWFEVTRNISPFSAYLTKRSNAAPQEERPEPKTGSEWGRPQRSPHAIVHSSCRQGQDCVSPWPCWLPVSRQFRSQGPSIGPGRKTCAHHANSLFTDVIAFRPPSSPMCHALLLALGPE